MITNSFCFVALKLLVMHCVKAVTMPMHCIKYILYLPDYKIRISYHYCH